MHNPGRCGGACVGIEAAELDTRVLSRLMRDLSTERPTGDLLLAEHTARQGRQRIAELEAGFRDACERTRLQYGLSEEECQRLWGTERNET